MKGFQFARMETFSVQGAPGKNRTGPRVRKSGAQAWTAKEVFDEAERVPLACPHVKPGGPPPQILPGSVSTFADARAEHAKAAVVKESYVRKGKKARRKLRSDAHSLYSSVVSLPTLTADALADPELRTESVSLLKEAMQHEQKRIEAAGGVLLMGVIHWDEDHVHAHYLAIQPQKGRVDGLHPGRTAKEAFNADHCEEKAKDPKAVGRGANRAYRAAMKEWQDDFYEGVFDRAGLLRYGPKRLRYTRAEYQKALDVKARQAKDEKRRAEEAAQFAEKEGRMKAILRETGSAAQELARQSVEMQGHRVDLLVRENEVSVLAAQSREEIKRSQAIASTASEKAQAIDRGITAIEAREIDYKPATGNGSEGLDFGPAAPKKNKERRSLQAEIMPAFDFLVGFARRAFRIRQREEAIDASEAAQLERMEAQEKQAADVRRRATIVEKAMTMARKVVPDQLAILMAGEPLPMHESSFPEAWAIPPGVDRTELRERLNSTTNLQLRSYYQATRDAARLSKDDESLSGKYKMGVKVIEANAAERGFDLETGRQDMKTAKAPEIASLHTDQFAEPFKVARRSLEKVKGRD